MLPEETTFSAGAGQLPALTYSFIKTPLLMSLRPTILSLSALRAGGLVLLLLLGARAQAQAPGSGGPTQGTAAVPLDGGASLLLVAGAAYGLRRLRRARR